MSYEKGGGGELGGFNGLLKLNPSFSLLYSLIRNSLVHIA